MDRDKLRKIMDAGDDCLALKNASDDHLKQIWSEYYDKPWPVGQKVHRSCTTPNCGHIKHFYPVEDMHLDDFAKSASEMTEDEILAHLAGLRTERRQSVTKTKVSRKVSADKKVKEHKKRPRTLEEETAELRKKLSKEDMAALRAEFGL